MSNQSALRLYRVGKKGRSVFLGRFASVATGLLPEATLQDPCRSGVHIQINDCPNDGVHHTLRGSPTAAEALIVKLALGVAEARNPGASKSCFGQDETDRTATVGVLMALVDKLTTPDIDWSTATYHRIAAE